MQWFKNSLHHVVLFLVILITSCTNSGPCDYDIVETEAKIVRVEKSKDSNLYLVELQFFGSNLADQNHFLHEFKKTPIDSAFIARNTIVKGKRYMVTVSDRLSGNCIEQIVSFNHRFR